MPLQELGDPMTKDFSVFDCDAHVQEPPDLWERAEEHLSQEEFRAFKESYWFLPGREPQLLLNGRDLARASLRAGNNLTATAIAGPGINTKLQRAFFARNADPERALTEEQAQYLTQDGAYEPNARLRDMDIQGIDQVMIVPSPINEHLCRIESHFGARAVCRAYNDWAHEYSRSDPDRIFPAALLPIQNVVFAVDELHRVAEKGFRLALIRPVDAQGNYPIQPRFKDLWSAFEETGLVCGMHTFTPTGIGIQRSPGQYSPGELITLTGATPLRQAVPNIVGTFIYEGATWVTMALLSGVLERHSRIRCGVFESNGPSWLPLVLTECDKLFTLYRKERQIPLKQLPSETFREHCFVGFEAEEDIVYAMSDRYEDIAVWASDIYHHDAADAWEALERMRGAGLPVSIQRKLLGDNARRMYKIAPKLVVQERVTALDRPEWWPNESELEDAMRSDALLVNSKQKRIQEH